MQEHSSQIVLLIRAFEETDRSGAIVPTQARAVATRRALRVTGLADWTGDLQEANQICNGETVSRRARLLFDSLARKIPALRGVLHVARLGAGTTPVIVGLAFLLGLVTNALGPERQINLLAAPLLGMLAWNLLIYIWWIFPVRSWRNGAAERLAGLLLKGAIRRRIRTWKRRESEGEDRLRITSRAVVRFGALWQRSAGALLAARVRRLLHVGALVFALGMLGGIYIRGIALEYRATWESTWLDAGQVQSLMNWTLGPAAAVLGGDVPAVAPLHAPNDGEAAPWIHFYAMTILLAVVVPRSGLALWESLCSTRLAANLSVDLDDKYYRQLFRDWRGRTTVVDIVPYSYAPSDAGVELLKNLLRDEFGARADLRLHDPLAYGDGPDECMKHSPGAGPWKPALEVGDELDDDRMIHCHAVLFNLAQTPEPEVHGVFLEESRERAGDRGCRLIVVLDGEAFARHVHGDGRKAERVRAWQAIARQAQAEAIVLEPES